MLLAIDVGNTNSVFALHDGEKYVADWRCATDIKRTADEYFVWLRQLLDHHGIDSQQIDDVVISSTAAGTMFNLRVLADRYFHVRPIVVGKPETNIGIDIRVTPGTRVGADRLVNTLSAFRTYGGDVIVVDFGTATTFDVVTPDGDYAGGVIAPGINLALDALHAGTAQLPRIHVARPAHVIGTDTVSAMESGIYWGYVGLIEGIVARIRAEQKGKVTVIATGGLAPLFAEGTDVIDATDPELTLRGIVRIYQRNRQGAQGS